MECAQCGSSLSIQELIKNEWSDDSEFFIIKCGMCLFETKITSPLFELEHISPQYLRAIAVDSDKKEKYFDYIPEEQRNKILKHLSSCQICIERVESIRLRIISKQINSNQAMYEFFLLKSKEVLKELDPQNQQIQINEQGIEGFFFEKQSYSVDPKNLFYHQQENDFEKYCYTLEKDEFCIGMVSFVLTDHKIILEKIWLKSEPRLEKEKLFIANLKSGKVRILFDLIQKIHHFV